METFEKREICPVCGLAVGDQLVEAARKDMPFDLDMERAVFAHAECAISDGMADDDEHIRALGVYAEERIA